MTKTEYYIWLSEHHHYHDISEKDAHVIFKRASEKGITVLHIESPDYPDLLREISDPPLVLFCLGSIDFLQGSKVAIVGTRRASPYGKWVAGKIGKELALASVTHVSGMAWGIDSFSHEAVLKENGKSIAVLGCGVDICYPKSSRSIYEGLKEKGLIVSEYPPGELARPEYFPARNRIISGLSEKVIVVEGAQKSGSLITAKLALEQGRDIFAVPGNINQPNSIGPNLLIYDGACPIADIDQIPETLGIKKIKLTNAQHELTTIQKEIIGKVKISGSLTIDELSQAIDLPVNYLLSELSLLEIKGLLSNNNGIISL